MGGGGINAEGVCVREGADIREDRVRADIMEEGVGVIMPRVCV